ncbi:hypothetical protein WP50_25435 [Lactiplantibacillus plantarum]|nr:hypothetical protein WP50_25435 [Lactiplantibacillus plantarum]
MNIKIICVGKLKEKYFKQGIAEYAKRMSKFAKFQIVEVPDEKAPESFLYAHSVNDTVTVKYYHNGKLKTANMKLTETTKTLTKQSN